MKKNIVNIKVSMAVFMAIAGIGISMGAGSLNIIAASRETNDGDINVDAENTSTESDAMQEVSEVFGGVKAEKKLPQGFSVVGLDDVKTMYELNDALENIQNKINEKKFILDVNGYKTEGSYAEIGTNIENKDFILEEAQKYTSGNMIDRFAKSVPLIEAPESLTPNVSFDETALNSFFERANSNNADAPKNASIKRVNGAFEITPEHDGYAVDNDSTVAKLKEAVVKNDEETIVAELTKHEATIKAEELESIKDVLGTFTTNYSSSSSARATNIAVGTSKMDGTLLMPGETVSGYGKMHPFTVENGYKIAKAYENGMVVDSVGGGACQIATTLYQAALRAEVTITERKNHSMVVGYVQPSGDATIAGDYKDIKITNNRSTPIYIEATTAGRDVTFTIWGKEDRPANRSIEFVSEVIKEIPKGKTYIDSSSHAVGYLRKESDGHRGRVSKLWKVVKEDGVEVSRELVSSDTYVMSNDVYIRGTRVDAPQPAPAETTENTEGQPENPEGPVDNPAPSDAGEVETTQAPDVNLGPGYNPAINSEQ